MSITDHLAKAHRSCYTFYSLPPPLPPASMNRYNYYGLAQPHASSPHNFNQSFKTERHDDRASLSGSEDSNYGLYTDVHKNEVDIEEEANVALTSQTLNPDGTPKRPMNAFMIFARRRRPQVSSENQALRTGEISKLLSKEWVSMPSNEKQFYLEQAKLLKDTFNTKYPDYVYRRRPNNSRKRRRSDSSSSNNMRPIDQNFVTAADHGDELLGNGDLEGSPVDSDEHVDMIGYSRPSHSVSHHQSFGEHHRYNMSQSRSEPPPLDRSNGQYDSRLSYGTSSNGTVVERFMQPPLAQPRHLQPDVNNYPYPQSQSHRQSSSAYHGVAPQGWPPRVERLQPTWLGNNDGQQQSGSMGRQPYSPSTPSSTWSNSSNGPSTPSSTSPNYFPTLTTPFYPGQSGVAAAADYPSVPSPHPMSTPPPPPLYEPVSHGHPNMMSKEYAPRVYSSTGVVVQLENSYPPSRAYPQRNLPRAETTMEYPNSQPSSSSSSSGHGYQWSRE